MIYTSYFANLRNLPENTIPVAICGKSPQGWKGLEYKKLAPKYWFFKLWKRIQDNDFYTYYYQKEVLDTILPHRVVDDLIDLTGMRKNPNEKHIILVCYEKPEDFCHRHLVAKWLSKYGYITKEWENK